MGAPAQMSEREKILAKLQAIKDRTLAAIHKENEGKGKRKRSEPGSRKSDGGSTKLDDKAKSREIIRDIVSSDEEDNSNNQESALDIMLRDHEQKTEKEKIARMARQA